MPLDLLNRIKSALNGGILSGKRIQELVVEGQHLRIDPFNPKHVNSTSYDLTLGDELAVYEGSCEIWSVDEALHGPPDGRNLVPFDYTHFRFRHEERHILDSAKDVPLHRFKIPEKGWVLLPGIGYLMHTRERVWSDKYNPVLDGKSSPARRFISVHETAGYGDPGFNGQYTLEVKVTHPVRVYAGMRIAQMRFHTILGDFDLYEKAGHYIGKQATLGPVASRIWMQIQEDRKL